MTSQGASLGRGCRLRGRGDHLGKLDQAEADRAGVDRAGVDRAGVDRAGTGQDAAGLDRRDLPASAGAASRDALLRRLEQLPPSHPSSVRAGESRDRSARTGQEEVAGRGVAADQRDSSLQDRPPTRQQRGDGLAPPGGPAPEGPDRPGTPGGPPPDNPDAAVVPFMDRVGHFESLWKAHRERWPEPADGASDADKVRPDDPPGSWRGAGDRYLAPDQNAEADQIIELLRKPEKAVTDLLQKIQQDSPHGGYLVGLDHRLKGADRLKEKIVEHIESEVGSTVTDAASEINDAVRYTFCFGPAEYVEGHGYMRQKLESAGCQMTYSKNHWIDNPEYRGINSRWATPEGDQFELQFHTPESFYAKDQLTHPSYKRLRRPDTSRAEQRALHDYQREVSSALPEPDRIIEIANMRKEPA